MQYRRRKKLVDPRLQLSLVGSFLGVALLGVMLQFLLMQGLMVREVQQIPGAGGEIVHRLPRITVSALGLTLAVLVPCITAVGVLLTFRIAGPVYRFEMFLRSVIAGQQVLPCKTRKGDQFDGLCALINEATAAQREAAAALCEDAEEPRQGPQPASALPAQDPAASEPAERS